MGLNYANPHIIVQAIATWKGYFTLGREIRGTARQTSHTSYSHCFGIF